MEISEIAPILRADKITVTISAEKNGKLRVIYQDWDEYKSVPFGHRLWGDFIGDPDLGRGSPIGDPDVLGRANRRECGARCEPAAGKSTEPPHHGWRAIPRATRQQSQNQRE
jgi:hypothetical protein